MALRWTAVWPKSSAQTTSDPSEAYRQLPILREMLSRRT